MKKNKTDFIVKGALIGALYVVLTVAVAPISYGPIQLRISEMLCILPIFTPCAVWGLFVGCILSNVIGMMLGSALAVDILFGSLATLIAAVLTRCLSKFRIKNFPFFSFFPPILCNALIVGAELSLFLPDKIAFWYSALTVGIGETLALFLLGTPLYFIVEKTKIFN